MGRPIQHDINCGIQEWIDEPVTGPTTISKAGARTRQLVNLTMTVATPAAARAAAESLRSAADMLEDLWGMGSIVAVLEQEADADDRD